MKKKIAIFKLILLVAIIVLVPLLLYINFKDSCFNLEWLEKLPNTLAENPKSAVLTLLGLQVAQVVISIIPGQPIQFAASYLFGVLGGYLISIIGAIIGTIISFFLAKILGTDAVKFLFDQDKVEYYRQKINSGKGLLIAFYIYIIPGLPKDILAYVAGISRMKFFPFVLVSTIGRTPPMFASLLVGSFLQDKNYLAMGIVALIVVVVLIISWEKRESLIRFLDDLESK